MSTYFEPSSDYPALELYTTVYIDTLLVEYADWWDALRAFVREEEGDLGPQLVPEIDRVFSFRPTEEELHAFFKNHVETSVNAPLHGYTWRTWLEEVRRVALDEQVKLNG